MMLSLRLAGRVFVCVCVCVEVQQPSIHLRLVVGNLFLLTRGHYEGQNTMVSTNKGVK